MGQTEGSFGSISYSANTITIEIESNTLGSLALTDSDGRIECYWDGTQWVCNRIIFNPSGQSSGANST